MQDVLSLYICIPALPYVNNDHYLDMIENLQIGHIITRFDAERIFLRSMDFITT
jgi:hypothetical protein